MRNKILFILLVIPIFIFAKIEPAIVDELTLDDQITLQQLSAEIHMPLKKLKECLGLTMEIENHSTLSELQIGKTEIISAIEKYNNQRHAYYRSIVLLGMAIVFSSLMITAVFISLLQHVKFEKKPKKNRKKKERSGKSEDESLQSDSSAIVAAITTVYMHEMEVEQQNNMMLTWKRAPLSLWKVSRILPNQEFYKAKRK